MQVMMCNPDVMIPWEVPFYSSAFIWLLLSLQYLQGKNQEEKRRIKELGSTWNWAAQLIAQ